MNCKVIFLSMCLVVNLNVVDVAFANFFHSNISDGFEKDVGAWGDQCILYVRSETGIKYSCCNGLAQNCYEQSKACSYSTGDVSKIGSIMIMGAWGNNAAGHAAIVIDIDSNNNNRVKVRDSNWGEDEIIQEHWIDTANDEYSWFKYIYGHEELSYDSNHGATLSYREVKWTNAFGNEVAVYWTPANVSCDNATKWIFRGVATDNKGLICETAYLEFEIFADWTYQMQDWQDTFFGNQNEFDSAETCSSN